MTKILHTADIHLDSPLRSLALRDPDLRDQVHTATRSAFTRIIDTAIAESVNALLIAGDLFDGAERSARTAAYLTGQLDRLRDGRIRVFYIKGNHDAENPLTGELSLPDNVHIFDGRGGKVQLSEDVWIHGVSFANRHAPESLLPKFPAPVAGAINIAMLHTSLVGAAGHDPYAPCTVNDLVAAGFDYWALGHVHRRQVHAESPWVVLPGGAGTLDEFFEVLTWRQLGLHNRPILLLDVNGYWQPLLGLMDHVIDEGFADASLRDFVTACPSVAALADTLRAALS